MTTGEYKRYKGLTKQNLRDNMTNVELALNTLADGEVAREARETMERRLGRSVVSSERASDYIRPIEGKGQNTLPKEDE